MNPDHLHGGSSYVFWFQIRIRLEAILLSRPLEDSLFFFLSLGILPGVLGADSPGIGIAIKVADGDQKKRVCPSLALEILKQTNFLSEKELEALAEFGPILKVKNWRKLVVGESRPVCPLKKAG